LRLKLLIVLWIPSFGDKMAKQIVTDGAGNAHVFGEGGLERSIYRQGSVSTTRSQDGGSLTTYDCGYVTQVNDNGVVRNLPGSYGIGINPVTGEAQVESRD